MDFFSFASLGPGSFDGSDRTQRSFNCSAHLTNAHLRLGRCRTDAPAGKCNRSNGSKDNKQRCSKKQRVNKGHYDDRASKLEQSSESIN